MNSPTLTRLLFDSIARYGDVHPAACRTKINDTWQAVSHKEIERRVQAITLGLRDLGVQAGDRVALLSETRAEWLLADYACLCAQAADVPIYPTLTADQTAYILQDSGACAVFCSTSEQVAKVFEVKARLPALKQVIVFDPAGARDGAMTLADLEARGVAAAPRFPRWREEALAAQPDALATLIYTSGTTGEPKGVILTHKNLCSNVASATEVFPLVDGDEALAMLPLSHVLERMVDYTLFGAGVVISYAESIDKIGPNLQEIRPTIAVAVPRILEKVYARVLENALSGSPLKRKIFFWAKRIGEAAATYQLAGLPVPTGLRLQRAVADRLVFSKLRARTGGRIKFFVTGSAPMSAEIAKFFFAAGLPVIEGYGLTETSPVLTLNPFDRPKLGSVGTPIPGVQIKIAADGEILAKGPNVMKGYYNKPDATRESIDGDGWFHTGDIGEVDADGYLKITDRKKDLIKTSGGKYVAPQPIENKVKLNKFVANAVLLGDQRKFPILLIVPNYEQLEPWARERRLPYTSRGELLALPDVKAKMEMEVMGMLRDLARFESPKKVVLLEQDFTIENGELTPTLKVKRRAVEKRYQTQIEAAYGDAEAHHPSTV